MNEQAIDCKVLNDGMTVRVTLGADDWRTAKDYRVSFNIDGEVRRVMFHRGQGRIGWTTAHTRGPQIRAAIAAAQAAIDKPKDID